MYCYKSRFRGYYVWNIWNQRYFVSLIPTSSNVRAPPHFVKTLCDTQTFNAVSENLVGQEELESSTSAVSERHSNQLNY